MITAEEPLAHVAYVYDGTPEGLLTAVFQAYANHEDPEDIAQGAAFQPRLDQSVRTIETDAALAERVKRGLVRATGKAGFNAVLHASLSDDVQAGSVVYRFIRYAMRSNANRAAIGEIAHPAVAPLIALDRSVMNERHLMQQFLRFECLKGNIWFARCSPKASVIPLLMDWFSARFNDVPFMIYDEAHRIAGIYDGSGWQLVQTDIVNLPEKAGDEEMMQQAWKRFYDAVSIDARYHPELRRRFMPKRFWENLPEMDERYDTSTDNYSLNTPSRSKAGMKLSSAAPPSCQK